MDKNKVIQAATRFVQRGQLDRAITELEKILRVDPKDVRVLLKIGELQQKNGDVATATETLLQVAEAYSSDGFFLKAVAVYKQVLKIDESLADVNLRLAELYQHLGLTQDAVAQYLLVAANHEKAGNPPSAIDAIRRIVDLDPENLAFRVKLAELLAQEGRTSAALQEFRRAAETFGAQGQDEPYFRVGERILSLDPDDCNLARKLAAGYLARGDAKRALAKLQACYGVDPKHAETLELLGRAFLELGQEGKAAAVYKELARAHADAGNTGVARVVWEKVLQLSPDDEDARAALGTGGMAPRPWGGSARVPAPIPSAPRPPPDESPQAAIERLLAETDVYVKYGLRDQAFDHLRRVLGLDPGCMEAHERVATLLSAGGDQAAAWAQLSTACRICADLGRIERGRVFYERLREEAPHLPELVALADIFEPSMSNGPLPQPVFEGLLEISHEDTLVPEATSEHVAEGVLVGDDEAMVAAVFSSDAEQIDEDAGVLMPGEDALAPHAGDDEAMVAAVFSSDAEQIDEDAGVLMPGEDELAEPDAFDDEAMAAAVLSSDAEQIDEDAGVLMPGDELAEPDAFNDEAMTAAVLSSDAEQIDEDAGVLMPGEDGLAGPDAAEGWFPGGGDDHGSHPGDWPEDAGEEVPLPLGGPAAPPEESVGALVLADDADPSLDRTVVGSYAAWGRVPSEETVIGTYAASLDWNADDPPPDEFDPIDEPISAKPAGIIEVGESPDAGETRALHEAIADIPDEPLIASSLEVFALDSKEQADLETELDEASFFIAQGLFGEAEDICRSILSRVPGHPTAEEILREIATRRGRPPSSADPLPGEPASATDLVLDAELEGEELALGLDNFQHGVEDVFARFKKNLSLTLRPEDSQLHYDLGIAYREMGLFGEAIEQLSAALAGFRGDSRELDCLSMIAGCRAELGEHDEAIARLEESLDLPGAVGQARHALLFDLGASLEARGEVEEALARYGEVEQEDPAFRDVGQVVARLRGSARATRKNRAG